MVVLPSSLTKGKSHCKGMGHTQKEKAGLCQLQRGGVNYPWKNEISVPDCFSHMGRKESRGVGHLKELVQLLGLTGT